MLFNLWDPFELNLHWEMGHGGSLPIVMSCRVSPLVCDLCHVSLAIKDR